MHYLRSLEKVPRLTPKSELVDIIDVMVNISKQLTASELPKNDRILKVPPKEFESNRIFSPPSGVDPVGLQVRSESTLFNLSFTLDDVIRALVKLEASKGTGPDQCQKLNRSTTVKYGSPVSHNLSWELHVRRICAKSYRILGFIHCSTKGTTNVLSHDFAVSTSTQFRSTALFFGRPVRRIFRMNFRGSRIFLGMVVVRLGYDYHAVPKEMLAALFSIAPLDFRRDIQNVFFLYKPLNYLIDTSELLHQAFYRC
ncbi:hypothetical protein J6590_073726 [Homalodisca vitripennis]|nr:hypothetical protein J6590_073726 [Homalodisca vitripennis]